MSLLAIHEGVYKIKSVCEKEEFVPSYKCLGSKDQFRQKKWSDKKQTKLQRGSTLVRKYLKLTREVLETIRSSAHSLAMLCTARFSLARSRLRFFARPFARSLAPLTHSLRSALLASASRAPDCAHSFAHSLPSSWERRFCVYEMYAWISYSFNPQWALISEKRVIENLEWNLLICLISRAHN